MIPLLLAGCPVLLPPPPAAERPAPPVDFGDAEVTRYPVEGADLRALTRSLGERGPLRGGLRYDAWTGWELTWNIEQVTAEDGGCAVGAVHLAAEIEVVLPDWAPPESAGARLRSAWGCYLWALERHELGHVERVRQGMVEMEAAVLAARCDQADAVAAAWLEAIRRSDRAYDEITGHGQRQGTNALKRPLDTHCG